jgi:predicted TIM-barrel fold metal-dependent hydrolase
MAMTHSSEMLEPVLEPELPIVDPHHHLWDRRPVLDSIPTTGWGQLTRRWPRYLLDELMADLKDGHDVRATVYLECGSFYRPTGPQELRCVGETEFANGMAAMSASGVYGDVRICEGIVANADLTRGDAVPRVLEAHAAAGGGRFRGVRQIASYDPDPGVLGVVNVGAPGLYTSDAFAAGFAWIGRMGLTFDAWIVEPQLPDLVVLARRFPDAAIVLDHVGTPLGVAGYRGRRDERFPIWRENIRKLAELPNVTVKLGGLGMHFCDFPSFLSEPPATSEQLAREWRPYIETCIEAFGVARCMFESNYPADRGVGSYRVIWNAFKRIAAGASPDEKAALFSKTAARVYRVGLAQDN